MPSLPLGLTWTELTATSSLAIADCIWADAAGVFVQVGSRSGNVGSGGNATRIRWSSDGVTWNEVSDSGLAYNWTGVTYAPPASGLGSGQGRLVAVTGTTLETLGATPTKQIITSDDGGATWTSRTSPEINSWQDVVWADSLNLFVAVANTGTNRVMTSSDGITWSASAASAVKAWASIAWDGTNLVATATTTSTTSVQTSTNGTTWTNQTTGNFSWRIRGTFWSPLLSLFVACSGSDHILTSPTGVTWTDQGAQSFTFKGCDASALGIIAISGGQSGGTYLKIKESDNGTSFTDENTDPGFIFTGGRLDVIAFSPTLSMLVITYNGNSQKIITGVGAVGSILTAAGDSTATWLEALPEFHFEGEADTDFDAGLTVTSITPNQGWTRGADPVTIRGTAFEPGATVSFGRYFGNFQEATDVIVVDDTTITCSTPPHTPDEFVTIVVTNHPSEEFAQLNLGFEYRLASFTPGGSGSFTITPDHGPISGGTLVTIAGVDVDISPTAIVLFDGEPATSVTPVNSSTITCITPAHKRGFVTVKIINS